MYGLDLSQSIAQKLKKTPQKYASLKSTRNRFDDHYKPRDTDALPFYKTQSSVYEAVCNSPRKLSSMRSKVERFPQHGFMQKHFDKSMIETRNKEYNTDTMHKTSMAKTLKSSPRRYATLRSKQPRFSTSHIDVPYGPGNGVGTLGPGSYGNIEPDTSTRRYLTTVGGMLISPRSYASVFQSRTPRFKSGTFSSAVGSGSSLMWPPMRR